MAMHINRVGERKDKKKLLIPNQRDVSQKCCPTMKRLSWKLKHYHENWYLTTKQRCLKNTNIATCVCVKKNINNFLILNIIFSLLNIKIKISVM
jgi:hypothetical protein